MADPNLPADPTVHEATSPLGAEPVAIPVWAAGFVGVALALGVDLLSDVDLRDAFVSALVALAPVLGVAVPIARRRAWSARSVRRKLDAG